MPHCSIARTSSQWVPDVLGRKNALYRSALTPSNTGTELFHVGIQEDSTARTRRRPLFRLHCLRLPVARPDVTAKIINNSKNLTKKAHRDPEAFPMRFPQVPDAALTRMQAAIGTPAPAIWHLPKPAFHSACRLRSGALHHDPLSAAAQIPTRVPRRRQPPQRNAAVGVLRS
jgi:hypothetical protein